ncbi:MAG: NlpC/P60 family protein [Daejeonella sp.]
MNQQFGVCNLSLVPVRTEPSDRSEMCSQLLFGDHFTVLEATEKWVRISTAYDDYEGWIDKKQFAEIEHAAFVALHDLNSILGLSINHRIVKTSSNEILNLVAGSNIPGRLDNFFYLRDTRYKLEGETVKPGKENFRSGIREAAMFYLNAPYLWGGKSVFGIDCSGFTQMVFRQFGIKIKRDAYQQAEQGELVGFLQEAKGGDLAFFDNEEGRITHVGIMLDSERIIHASGRVKIDPIDNQGIYSNELKKYTHKLRIVKRF